VQDTGISRRQREASRRGKTADTEPSAAGEGSLFQVGRVAAHRTLKRAVAAEEKAKLEHATIMGIRCGTGDRGAFSLRKAPMSMARGRRVQVSPYCALARYLRSGRKPVGEGKDATWKGRCRLGSKTRTRATSQPQMGGGGRGRRTQPCAGLHSALQGRREHRRQSGSIGKPGSVGPLSSQVLRSAAC
jgi:hypothetical protein